MNARDVQSPDDLDDPAATCWVKMSDVGIEGMRQAFLDPGSRIRLHTDPLVEAHAELVAITWQGGGFLDNATVRFNPNLNVLVGGRGAGKSTVIESLRHALGLEPLGENARAIHKGIIRNVLRSGTKVSLLVRRHRPSPRDYLIERTIPNPPVVRDGQTGDVLNVEAADVFPGVEIYGQHEISELTASPEKLTRLLERFVERDDSASARKHELRQELERSRGRILAAREERARIDLEDVRDRLKAVLDRAVEGMRGVRERFEARRAAVQSEYEEKLRDLQKSRIDGEEFIRLRRRIEELRPLKGRQSALARTEADEEERRRNLLAEWEDVKAGEFRALERAGKRVTRRLDGRVRVRVEFAGNRESLFQLLRDEVGECENRPGVHGLRRCPAGEGADPGVARGRRGRVRATTPQVRRSRIWIAAASRTTSRRSVSRTRLHRRRRTNGEGKRLRGRGTRTRNIGGRWSTTRNRSGVRSGRRTGFRFSSTPRSSTTATGSRRPLPGCCCSAAIPADTFPRRRSMRPPIWGPRRTMTPESAVRYAGRSSVCRTPAAPSSNPVSWSGRWRFVRRNIDTVRLEDGVRRQARWDYPEDAVREAVVNAIVHRDYLLSGTDIELSIYLDRLEVVSPGRLPNGITPARMRSGCRSARNELLKDVMRDYGYPEHMGMGIPRKIMRSMRDHNGTDPELVETDEGFLLRLWKNPRA